MSKPSEYLCTERNIKTIEQADLPLNALRLVHGCHYYVDSNPKLSMMRMAALEKLSYTVRCSSILAATGTPKANDYDMIKSGIDAISGKKIFDMLNQSDTDGS